MSKSLAPALSQQLQLTARVIEQVQQGRSATAALDAVPFALRPGVQSLSFLALRSLGVAQAILGLLAKRAPPAPVAALLQTVLALLCSPEENPYDTFTLVNQAVEAAKSSRATRPQAPFINACLRRFLRERTALLAQAQRHLVAQFNHPAWWIGQLQHDWPDLWEQILAANNRHAPLTLRVNHRKISTQDYLQLLVAQGVAGHAVGSAGVELDAAVPVRLLPGFEDGLVSVQDAAAQLAANLLLTGLPGAPLRVLDACAAPGGKTAHLLETSDCELTALDIDANRCQRISQNLQRLGLTAKVIAADAGDVASWWQGVPFDAILLDAPCSASGIVRRHPDIRWLRRPSDLTQLAEIQARLLNTLWPLLKPGGRLLYSTCSVFKGEGEEQIKEFLERNKTASLLQSPGHMMPGALTMATPKCEPAIGDHDGFYYALLEKSLA